jgi:hypothetical protein
VLTRHMGLGPSKQEFDATQQKLRDALKSNAALASEKNELELKLQSQASTLQQQQALLADATQVCAQRLDAKDEEVNRALKQKQLAEDLRRSDALLAKRLLNAQLRHLGGDSVSSPQGAIDGSAMAAAIALDAREDELQLRQVSAPPPHCTEVSHSLANNALLC